MNQEKPLASPSEKLREQQKNLLLVLVGAVVFAFLMGMLGNLVVNHFMLNTSGLGTTLAFVLPTLASICLSYFLYYRYVFVPYSQVRKEAIIQIIYDAQGAEVIPDPFDGYYPQQLAWQAFVRFKSSNPKTAEERIKADIGTVAQGTQRHILTDLLEYLLLLQLRSELYLPARAVPAPDETPRKLPAAIERNLFIEFFRDLKPANIVDAAMQHVEPNLPKDVKINYWSPAPTRGGITDSFRIGLAGKYIDVNITASLISLSLIQTLKSGAAPVFDTMYIRNYWEKEILKKLPSLRKIVFYVNVEAQAKLRFGIIRKLSYLDWADEWASRVTTTGHMGSFDFIEFKKNRMDNLLLKIFEDSRETNELVNKLTEQHRDD